MPRLSFTDPDQWQVIHSLRNGPPPTEQPALYSWIHAQHIDTSYERHLNAAFDKVIRQHVGTNECWLAISGPSHLGKSTAVTHVLSERALTTDPAWRTRTKSGYLRTPYVYVEAASKGEARSILASIARFCGLPDTGHEKELHEMLANTLPKLGVQLIVVDDAQMYRRVSDVASRLTDGLRHLLHLPVPFAFVGIDLDRSALLRDPGRNNDTVHQLQRRHFQVRLTPVPRDGLSEIGQIARSFVRKVKPVTGLRTSSLGDPRLLFDLTKTLEGRPGSLINTFKRACVEALAGNQGVVTPELVRAEATAVQAFAREFPEPA